MATATASPWGDESAASHFSKFALRTENTEEWCKQPPALVNAADPRFPDSAVDLSDICGDSDSNSVANLSDICGFNDLNSPRSAVSSPRSGLGSPATSQPNSANNSGALSIISDTPSNTSSGNSRPSTGRVSLAQQLLQQQMGGNARFTSINPGSKGTNVASLAGISDYGSYTGSPVTPLMPSFSCASSEASGQSPANRAWRQSSDPRAVSQQTATMRESSLREKLLRASSAAASETSSQSSWHEQQSQAASAYSARESASAGDDYYCEPEENEQGELDFSDIKSVCLNFDEAQQQSEEMEFQRARLETVDIVPLASGPRNRFMSAAAVSMPEHVLFALTFSNSPALRLPGDESIQKLFPLNMQQRAAQDKPQGPAHTHGSAFGGNGGAKRNEFFPSYLRSGAGAAAACGIPSYGSYA
ncbi:unnamed protein product [Closterium sp. Naga37s-1]|nr:unnamed protein product [Closterium sp. Naga37s-1]